MIEEAKRTIRSEEAVVQLGCIVCRNEGFLDSPATIHHLRSGTGMGQKDKRFIPLCPLHHQLGGHGVAFHAGKKAWERRYGTQEGLYAQVRDLIQ